jgi:hypothetical protein
VDAPRTSRATQNSENPPISEIVLRESKQALLGCFISWLIKRRVLYLTPKFDSVLEHL